MFPEVQYQPHTPSLLTRFQLLPPPLRIAPPFHLLLNSVLEEVLNCTFNYLIKASSLSRRLLEECVSLIHHRSLQLINVNLSATLIPHASTELQLLAPNPAHAPEGAS